TAGQEVSVPVTIIEVPAMKIVAVRLYRSTVYGLEAMTEFWTKKLDKELADRVMVPKKVQSLKKLDKVDLSVVEDVR
ncbi:MAG: 50S ribosomal protein L3, partial [Thermoplasmata archaeon]|nr:50S ribosomal protein L3 [Thermoplasmata archaeon]NIS10941.1 50S ribosomal protein L3 [Thermoplasmata archaeon]NIS18870.1 50S ribosomal protein L3 [Thermoplasmata archaeon]NIT75900.1 50S ribosomal protein L3 [Thermoplasmata archaeon]NIU48024.1 50S ribosomal protein L3 [Thermoplasmata archaeon]